MAIIAELIWPKTCFYNLHKSKSMRAKKNIIIKHEELGETANIKTTYNFSNTTHSLLMLFD